jgi:gluconate 2-dehydrogenase gamma chain
MAPPDPSRRQFVTSSASFLAGGWLLLTTPAIATLASCARRAAENGEPLESLTAVQAAALRAFAARIVPSDELPGATEAGAIYFIDRAIADRFSALRPRVRTLAAELDGRAREQHARRFADLAAAAQDELLRAIEQTPEFAIGRMLVIMGVFADPSYGGNRDGAGSRIASIEPHAAYRPPFGWYDAQLARDGGGP